MTQEEAIEMAQTLSDGWWLDDAKLLAFVNLVMERQRKNIKHSLVASTVSVQSRVYVGEEVISNLRMTHEEIRARGNP